VTRAVSRALHRGGTEGGIVLDFACGSGIASHALALAGRRVVGLDISMSMLQLARTLSPAPAAAWVCGDIERPPFRSDAAAAVICLRFFPHMPTDHWEAVLRALASLTAGPIVIGLPMRRSSKHWWRAFKRRLGANAKRRPIFRASEIAPILSRAGLELTGHLWQSPFTDTALVIARRPATDTPQSGAQERTCRPWSPARVSA
jgi:SAM-dependent methyltransferase